MDFQAFEIALGFLAGFVGLTSAIALMTWPARDRATFFLGALLLLLAFALGLRSWALSVNSLQLLSLAHATPALLPAALLLYYQERFRRQLPRFFKLEVLAFTFLLFATSKLSISPIGVWWHLALFMYLLSAAVYFLISVHEEKAPMVLTGLRLGTLFIFVFVLLIGLHGMQFFASFRPETSLAAYATMILAHALAQGHFADRPFRFQHEVKHLVAYGLFAILATSLLSFGGVMLMTTPQYLSCTGLLFGFILAFMTVFTQTLAAADVARGLRASSPFDLWISGWRQKLSQKFYRDSKFGPDQKHV